MKEHEQPSTPTQRQNDLLPKKGLVWQCTFAIEHHDIAAPEVALVSFHVCIYVYVTHISIHIYIYTNILIHSYIQMTPCILLVISARILLIFTQQMPRPWSLLPMHQPRAVLTAGLTRTVPYASPSRRRKQILAFPTRDVSNHPWGNTASSQTCAHCLHAGSLALVGLKQKLSPAQRSSFWGIQIRLSPISHLRGI